MWYVKVGHNLAAAPQENFLTQNHVFRKYGLIGKCTGLFAAYLKCSILNAEL